MNAKELRSEVASYRLKLRNRPPKLVTNGPNGPIDMDLIDVIVQRRLPPVGALIAGWRIMIRFK